MGQCATRRIIALPTLICLDLLEQSKIDLSMMVDDVRGDDDGRTVIQQEDEPEWWKYWTKRGASTSIPDWKRWTPGAVIVVTHCNSKLWNVTPTMNCGPANSVFLSCLLRKGKGNRTWLELLVDFRIASSWKRLLVAPTTTSVPGSLQTIPIDTDV